MEKFEHKVAITGIGMSQVGRRLMRDPLGLTVEACKAALADAGLEREDIDGLSTYPGASYGAGMSGGGIFEVENVLRVNPRWFSGGSEIAGQMGAVVHAAMAVALGLCRHVLCFRTVWEATYQAMARSGQLPAGGGGRVSGDMQWRFPYGAASAANWIAMFAQRHFHEYGTTREQLGAIALNARRNAQQNPRAIYRDPLTLEDYLSARMISTPFGLYDCDIPCDGSVAVIVSHIDTARDLRQPPVRLEAAGTAHSEPISWDQAPDLSHEVGLEGCCDMLWKRTDLRPSDVDVAELYDGFSFNCLCWIERMGFCPIGEGGRFVEGGGRIALDGELPLNTDGGQLSAGRLHGFGFIHEAVVQLRGQGGERQVPGDPQVAAVSTGGGTPGGCALFIRG